MQITFTKDDIRKAKFVDLIRDWDDGDYLWSGLLQLNMNDGTKKEYKCDWIRSGDKADVKEQNMEAIIDYLECYEPEEIQ